MLCPRNTLQIAKIGGGPNMAGDFTFGDEAADAFFRKYGDEDGNNVVDLPDFAAFRRTFDKSHGEPGYLGTLDSNGDAIVGLPDFAEFRRNFGT